MIGLGIGSLDFRPFQLLFFCCKLWSVEHWYGGLHRRNVSKELDENEDDTDEKIVALSSLLPLLLQAAPTGSELLLFFLLSSNDVGRTGSQLKQGAAGKPIFVVAASPSRSMAVDMNQLSHCLLLSSMAADDRSQSWKKPFIVCFGEEVAADTNQPFIVERKSEPTIHGQRSLGVGRSSGETKVLHWQPNAGTTVNTQILTEVSQCVEGINGVKEGRLKATLSFYKPMLKDIANANEFPRDFWGISLQEQPDKYYFVIRGQRLVMEAESSIQNIMEKLQSYKTRVALNFEGFQYQLGDFRLRVGKVVPIHSESLRGIVMEMEYLPISSWETSHQIMGEFFDIWKDALSKRSLPVCLYHGSNDSHSSVSRPDEKLDKARSSFHVVFLDVLFVQFEYEPSFAFQWGFEHRLITNIPFISSNGENKQTSSSPRLEETNSLFVSSIGEDEVRLRLLQRRRRPLFVRLLQRRRQTDCSSPPLEKTKSDFVFSNGWEKTNSPNSTVRLLSTGEEKVRLRTRLLHWRRRTDWRRRMVCSSSPLEETNLTGEEEGWR
nr:mediator of RNA polymerase II transcription subunit 20A-like [Ipomoea batatas]